MKARIRKTPLLDVCVLLFEEYLQAKKTCVSNILKMCQKIGQILEESLPGGLPEFVKCFKITSKNNKTHPTQPQSIIAKLV